MNYLAYISSAVWRNNPARLRELAAANFACRLCPNEAATGARIEVHHRTYERLGSEIDGDLIALCSDCHLGVTTMLRARRYANSQIPEVGDTWVQPALPLFDEGDSV
ncbi:HNH endonuclease [Bradyrhizobium sp. WSM1743]|uniref:HNH endonuclease n=1 Tax=Bradyrhizobium sp. WSM1743 TaxID=318996 RepID=UPI0003FC6362|nr:HNH endonuclease [Bradyrhizobium sp. WSM1743]